MHNGVFTTKDEQRVLKEYRDTLALQVKNAQRLKQIMDEYTQFINPEAQQQLPNQDTRDIYDKASDVLTFRTEICTLLRRVMSGSDAFAVSNKLDINEMLLVYRQIVKIEEDCKRLWNGGIPQTAFFEYLSRAMGKADINSGIPQDAQYDMTDTMTSTTDMTTDNSMEKINEGLVEMRAIVKLLDMTPIGDVSKFKVDRIPSIGELGIIFNSIPLDELRTIQRKTIEVMDRVPAVADFNEAYGKMEHGDTPEECNQGHQDMNDMIILFDGAYDYICGLKSQQIEDRGLKRDKSAEEFTQSKKVAIHSFTDSELKKMLKKDIINEICNMGYKFKDPVLGQFGETLSIDEVKKRLEASKKDLLIEYYKRLYTDFINNNQGEYVDLPKKLYEQEGERILPSPPITKKPPPLPQQPIKSEDDTIEGTGMSRSKKFGLKYGQGVERKPYVPFGRYVIHRPQLENNTLQIKYPSGQMITHIKKQPISTAQSNILKKIIKGEGIRLDDIEDMLPNERNHLHSILTKAQIDHQITKTKDRRNTDDEDMRQLDIYIGEFEAGNDSDIMLRQLKALLVKMVKNKRLSKQHADKIIYEMAENGI